MHDLFIIDSSTDHFNNSLFCPLKNEKYLDVDSLV